jgi:hypothetical protein
MANLERRAATIPQEALQTAVMSGRVLRILRRPAGCASSVLLATDQLKRLFGEHDQVFGAPGRHTLLSFPIDMPTATIADLHVGLELDELMPLFLLPFIWQEGRLVWSDRPDGDDKLD